MAAELRDTATAICGPQSIRTINPYQPPPEDVSFISQKRVAGGETDDLQFYGNNQSNALVEGIPFSRYWQAEDKENYVFHPMVWGRYVFNSAEDRNFANSLRAKTDRVGARLPNGAIAFYYPNHYPLARMMGPELVYSCISQSEALAGYTRAERSHPDLELEALTDAVCDGLFLPHHLGGVDLGVAQLEIPLFRANPEIILNGWLHALFNLTDFAIVREDERVAAYVERNLRFFVDHHHLWYDEERHISRYSETCPIRVTLRPERPDQSFQTVYRSRVRELDCYAFPLAEDFEKRLGGYDNRIVSRASNGVLTAVTTISGLFDTFITSAEPFELRLRPGGYDPRRATPDGSGEWHALPSTVRNGVHAVELDLLNTELFRGYPTNFAKANGKNFYRVQHIVALGYIAQSAHFLSRDLFEECKVISQRWSDSTDKTSYDRRFEEASYVLEKVNDGKILNQITDIKGIMG